MARKKARYEEDVENVEIEKSESIKKQKKDRSIKLNKEQQLIPEALNTKDLVFVEGTFGTGKTLATVYSAIQQLKYGNFEKIIITRPFIPDKGLGALPGDLSSKTCFEMQPILDNFYEIIGQSETEKLISDGVIKLQYSGKVKGLTMQDAIFLCDECIPFDYMVKTQDGSISISKIKSGDEIITYNEETKKNETKKVLRAWSNGVKNVTKISMDNKSYLECTENHMLFTASGWKHARDIQIGDSIFTLGGKQSKKILNSDQKDLIVGSILGDGSLNHISDFSYRMNFIHCENQKDYLFFKSKILNREHDVKIIDENGYSKKPAYVFTTKTFYIPGLQAKNKIEWAIENLNHKSLAISIQDDGYFDKKNFSLYLHSTAYSEEYTRLFSEKLKKIGYKCSFYTSKKPDGRKHYVIRFTKKSTEKVLKDTCMYFTECMSYKNPYFNINNKYEWNNNYEGQAKTVTNIEKNYRECEVFDLEVENNHNFYINKKDRKEYYLVHNCQDQTWQQFVRLLSRLGSRSKMICTMSKEQIDDSVKDNSCYYDLLCLKDSDFVGWIELLENHRHGLINKVIEYVEEKKKGV